MKKGSQFGPTNDPAALRIYNGRDNVMQSHLEGRCEERLAETHRGRELFDNYTALQVIADDMTYRGVRVDRSRRHFHHHALRTRMGQASTILTDIAARMGLKTFSVDKRDDWARLFFGKFNVKPTKFSEKTNAPSLDEEALKPLITHPNSLVQAAARAGLQYRRWGTLDRNHVRGLRLDSRSVVHPFWKPTGTIGQRWTGSRPNPQNIPKPVEERLPNGKRRVVHGGLRDMFVPQAEGGWIVEADAKQIELRIAAFLCGDKPLLDVIDAFDAGEGPDPHTVRALEIFGIKDRKPTDRERMLSKNFVYGGILYGGTVETIHGVLSVDSPIEVTLVERMINNYLAAHPALPKWHSHLVREANRLGYVEEPISGRRRHFWGRPPPTEIYNFPVQTLAGYIINLAIQRVSKELRWGVEGINFQVHDSLVLDGPDPLRLAEILLDKMEVELELNGLRARFPVDVKVGGVLKDKASGTFKVMEHSSWAPNSELSLDEIAKLKKGKGVLAK